MRLLSAKAFGKKFNLRLTIPCLQSIIEVKPTYIPFTPLAQMKCMNCGAYRRKKRCPPFVPSYFKYEAMLRSKFSKCYIFVYRTDGTIYWKPKVPKDMVLEVKKDRGLKGAAAGLQAAIHEEFRQIRILTKGRFKAFVAGPCKKCGVRGCNVKGRCLHPPASVSMEGAGIDVYGLMDKLLLTYTGGRLKEPYGGLYQQPIRDWLTCVSMLALRGK